MASTQTTPKAKKPTKAQLAAQAAAQPKLETPPVEPQGPEVIEEQRKADRRADDLVKSDAFAQFVAGQTQPPVQTPPAALEQFNAEVAKLKEKYGVTVDVKAKPAKGTKDQRNGVTRPAADTTTGKVWATADAISAANHSICAIAALKEHKDMQGVNEHTIKTQYAKWRQFHGVTGRLPKLHAVHQVQGEYDGLKPVEPPKSE